MLSDALVGVPCAQLVSSRVRTRIPNPRGGTGRLRTSKTVQQRSQKSAEYDRANLPRIQWAGLLDNPCFQYSLKIPKRQEALFHVKLAFGKCSAGSVRISLGQERNPSDGAGGHVFCINRQRGGDAVDPRAPSPLSSTLISYSYTT